MKPVTDLSDRELLLLALRRLDRIELVVERIEEKDKFSRRREHFNHDTGRETDDDALCGALKEIFGTERFRTHDVLRHAENDPDLASLLNRMGCLDTGLSYTLRRCDEDGVTVDGTRFESVDRDNKGVFWQFIEE